MDPNFNPGLLHKATCVTPIHLPSLDITMKIINRNWILPFYRFSANLATHWKIGQWFGAKQKFLHHTVDLEQGLAYLKPYLWPNILRVLHPLPWTAGATPSLGISCRSGKTLQIHVCSTSIHKPNKPQCVATYLTPHINMLYIQLAPYFFLALRAAWDQDNPLVPVYGFNLSWWITFCFPLASNWMW